MHTYHNLCVLTSKPNSYPDHQMGILSHTYKYRFLYFFLVYHAQFGMVVCVHSNWRTTPLSASRYRKTVSLQHILKDIITASTTSWRHADGSSFLDGNRRVYCSFPKTSLRIVIIYILNVPGLYTTIHNFKLHQNKQYRF